MSPIRDEWQSPDGAVRLILGDALAVLPLLDRAGIGAVVTDPPYGIELNTDYTSIGGINHSPIKGDGAAFDFSPFSDLAIQEQFWFGANNYKPPSPEGSWMCWDKYPTDRNEKRLSGAFEIIWSKQRHKSRLLRIPAINTNWITTKEHVGHPTQKPIRLMQELVIYCKAGKTVVDFYMGSCPTGVACIRTGRRFIGIEIEPKYFTIAVKRCQAELERFPLFEQPKPRQQEIFT